MSSIFINFHQNLPMVQDENPDTQHDFHVCFTPSHHGASSLSLHPMRQLDTADLMADGSWIIFLRKKCEKMACNWSTLW